MMSRIKGAPSKLWNDWKLFRNYPGMEYRDIHEIIPKSHMWKYPSQASIKYENEVFNKDYFKWDYKLAFRNSPYFIRRIFPEASKKCYFRYAYPLTKEDIAGIGSSNPNWKDAISDLEFVSVNNDHQTLAEKHDEYFDLVKNSFETTNYLDSGIYNLT